MTKGHVVSPSGSSFGKSLESLSNTYLELLSGSGPLVSLIQKTLVVFWVQGMGANVPEYRRVREALKWHSSSFLVIQKKKRDKL